MAFDGRRKLTVDRWKVMVERFGATDGSAFVATEETELVWPPGGDSYKLGVLGFGTYISEQYPDRTHEISAQLGSRVVRMSEPTQPNP